MSRKKKPIRKTTKKQPRPQKKDVPQADGLTNEIFAVFLTCLGVFCAIALSSKIFGLFSSDENAMGVLGEQLSSQLVDLFGWCALLVIPWFFVFGWTFWSQEKNEKGSVFLLIRTTFSAVVLFLSAATITALFFGASGGGRVGYTLNALLIPYLNKGGAFLFSFGCLVVSFGLATGIESLRVFRAFGRLASWLSVVLADAVHLCGSLSKVLLLPATLAKRLASKLRRLPSRQDEEPEDFVLRKEERRLKLLKTPPKREEESEVPEEEDDCKPDPKIIRRAEPLKPKLTKNPAQKKRYLDYELPTLDHLVASETSLDSSPQDEELVENAKKLEKTLSDFKVEGSVVEVHPGPVITLYEFLPGSGVKVNRVVNLADDLALALKVASVRVYAPVPGKGTVGIEVPNSQREIVRLRDVLASDEFSKSDAALNIALGKDTFGDAAASDLARMPHLLIAGATGTGKSVCLNSILLSLLYRNTPEDMRLLLIDPKMLELTTYEAIPHLKSPVVTNPKHAFGVLYWAVEEMERRYKLMRELGVRNLSGYNRSIREQQGEVKKKKSTKSAVVQLEEKDVVSTLACDDRPLLDRDNSLGPDAPLQHEVMPRIVIVVDELADLMLTVGRDIEELLTRLAQKARAAGIHLILATQRPSVNVITGLIKANFPARISFQVASKIDARTVLDRSGAERLLGQGDMLFLHPGSGRVRRMHSAFVSDREVQDVVASICAQGSPDYDPRIAETIKRLGETEKTSTGLGGEEYDPLYDQAVQLVVEKGQASTSMIQRAFRIGYNRAARILETMEVEGVVGPADGARPREILAPRQAM